MENDVAALDSFTFWYEKSLLGTAANRRTLLGCSSRETLIKHLVINGIGILGRLYRCEASRPRPAPVPHSNLFVPLQFLCQSITSNFRNSPSTTPNGGNENGKLPLPTSNHESKTPIVINYEYPYRTPRKHQLLYQNLVMDVPETITNKHKHTDFRYSREFSNWKPAMIDLLPNKYSLILYRVFLYLDDAVQSPAIHSGA